jgi:hypothetical protein
MSCGLVEDADRRHYPACNAVEFKRVCVLIGTNLYMPLDDRSTHMETANDMFLATSKSLFERLRYLSRTLAAISQLALLDMSTFVEYYSLFQLDCV